MSPTIRVTWEFCVTDAHEAQRRRPGLSTLVRWARRWVDRHGFEVTEPPVVRVLGGRSPSKRLRWTMFVRPVQRG